jgi:uncharacterized Zn finger protein (UPF0148 family)
MKSVNPDSISYRKSILTSEYKVTYDCPGPCKASLVSSLHDAGTNDYCPNCGCGFIVPGQEKVQEIKIKQQEERDAAEQRKRSKTTFPLISIDDSKQVTTKKLLNPRYPSLNLYLWIASFFANAIGLLGCIGGVILFMMGYIYNMRDWNADEPIKYMALGILIIIVCIIQWIVMRASIELIKVLLDIEESVRHLRKNG